MINWNGKRRWVALLLLIAGFVVMLTIPPIIPVIQLPGEKYPGPVDAFRVSNSLVGSIIVWILLILLMVYVRRKMPKSGDEVPPGGLYNMFEILYEGLYGFVHNIVGERWMRYIFSFFMTIMLIVVLSNWLELVPGVDSVGFLEPRVTTNAQGQVEYESGYETTGSGVYILNPKCPWISPAEAATLTDAQKTSRANNGCLTGVNAVASTTTTTVTNGETTVQATPQATVVAAETETPAGATAATTINPTQNQAEEAETAPGSTSVPWAVLPFVRAPSTDLNMTASLALIAVIMTQVLGFRALGVSYLTKFFNFKTLLSSPLGGIDVAVGLLELIGEFAKILSFSFRLLGNIFAGSILLFVMSFLIPFLPWPFFILEFFVGALQAFVFGLLTAIFMSQATAGHGEHHDENHEVEEVTADNPVEINAAHA
ncbi:MAG TPA: F0F1 ATP synthase subunit A [Phototrophicaceae bacterium]|nr:F0F1 ATP synthase subunit A [Phototrophicaceae bacterium]